MWWDGNWTKPDVCTFNNALKSINKSKRLEYTKGAHHSGEK